MTREQRIASVLKNTPMTRREAEQWVDDHPQEQDQQDRYEQRMQELERPADPAGAVVRCLKDVQPEAIRWLWPDRIALGKLTLIAGDPGLGKSMVTVALAAVVSTAGRWPVDGTTAPIGEVIMLSAEDDAADTIRPRLDAAGADVSRVYELEAVRIEGKDGPEEQPFSLREDVAILDDLLTRRPDVRLVTIDPVSAYLGSVDSHNNAEVRALLAPLAKLAARHGVAVVAVTHLNKGQGPALYRATGSLAFVAAARAVYAVTKDKDDDARRLVLPIKNNIGPDHGGLAYSIEVADNGAPVIGWEPDPVTMTAEEAMAPNDDPEERDRRQEACEWLRAMLEGGQVAVKQLQDAAKRDGHAWRTVQRAKNEIRACHHMQGFGKDRANYWYLSDGPPPFAPDSLTHGANGANGDSTPPEPAPVLDSSIRATICASGAKGGANERTRATTGFSGGTTTIRANSTMCGAVGTNAYRKAKEGDL